MQGSSISAVRIERAAHPVPSGGVSADQRGCVVRDRIELSTFRFSEGFPGPRESTTVRLSRPEDVSGHLGVHSRPHLSTAVVSTALAVGLFVPKATRGVTYHHSYRGWPAQGDRFTKRRRQSLASLARRIIRTIPVPIPPAARMIRASTLRDGCNSAGLPNRISAAVTDHIPAPVSVARKVPAWSHGTTGLVSWMLAKNSQWL
jgi:hypothetical protein